MEGKAVEELISQIKKRELGVGKMCHDNDSETSFQMEKSFGVGKQVPPFQNQQGWTWK